MSDPAQRRETVLPLARKLVALAQEQQRALELGAREQFDWIALRRDDVTERLSRLLAAEVPVREDEAASLQQLRDELLAVDGTMEQYLSGQLADAASKRRSFGKGRKALDGYLTLGLRRSGFVDKRQ